MVENVYHQKWINVCVSAIIQKIHHVCEKDYTWNSATWSCENGKYLGNIIDDSVVTCNEK